MHCSLQCVWLVVLLAAQGSALAADAPATGIRGVILDAGSNKPLPARVTILSSDGKYYFPHSESPTGSAVELRKQRGRSIEMHTTLSADPFVVTTPPGEYQVIVERGKEYFPATNIVAVTTNGITKTEVKLYRWINMAARGWFSGDTHIHRPLTEITNVMLAEDLNVAFPLSHWVTVSHTNPTQGNQVKSPVPKPEPLYVDHNHVIYPFNTEYEIFNVHGKSHTLGAVLLLNHTNALDVGVPPLKPVAETIHREGGIVCLEKHSWPWTLAIVPLMKADLFELSNNHIWETEFGLGQWTLDMAPPYMHLDINKDGYTEWGWIEYGFRTYYSLLNCGFKLRPTAGTAAGVHPVPMGFGRVYVNQPKGFTYENWVRELRAGNSFVTTGPMLFFTVNSQPPGHTFIQTNSPASYQLSGSVESSVPLDRIEIVINGEVVKTLVPENSIGEAAGFVSAFNGGLSLDSSAWIAVRAFEKHPGNRLRFAHSSPVFIEVPGKPVRPKAEQIDYIIGQIEAEITRDQGVLSDAELGEYREALETYRHLKPSDPPKP